MFYSKIKMMLFSPIKFRNVELPNRIVMSPMCMYSAEDGLANDFHFVHYVSRAQGGTGLIIFEATAVSPEGRISPYDLGIWDDSQIISLKKINDFIHQNTSSKTGIQLAYAGRKASTINGKQIVKQQGGWQTVAPSPMSYQPGEAVPHELNTEEISNIVSHFALATKRAVAAGFDVVEIHAAHGYLLHQFLSPLTNLRTDQYGGSFENRSRLLLEVVAAVQQELTDNQALFVRISADEYAEGGWDLLQSTELSNMLKSKGLDLVDVSSGGNIHGVKIPVFDGYQVPFSEHIRKSANIPTGAVGLITTATQAEEILKNHQADLIFLGRELLRNPYFAVQSAFALGEDCAFPIQYSRAKKLKSI